ncbi:MAG: YifB family Mg chelatase-like AAA ATPase, partial [Chloroflexi bacterium]|nr:YifB family Mg chelatase-like AAA ATPase [Chloroflexota bacterium]
MLEGKKIHPGVDMGVAPGWGPGYQPLDEPGMDAAAMLAAASSGQLQADLSHMVLLGELSLEGQLRHTDGVLSMVSVARDHGLSTAVVPQSNAREAALIDGMEVVPVASLRQLTSHLRGETSIPTFEPPQDEAPPLADDGVVDLADIRGQEHAKRALEVAAAGGHNLLMSGPPGSGKTLLARTLPSILPKMTHQEAIEVTKIYSVGGLLPASSPLVTERPFRSPHYTISNAGLVGGGRQPRPGEITLSHRGVLFLDELPEFGHTVLEVLRQPVEDKVVTISRAQGSVTFPANFMLVAAMNPCACGFASDPVKECTCTPSAISRYRRRISGPLLDRIDMFVEVPRVEYEKLVERSKAESSKAVRGRIEGARVVQAGRFAETPLISNAEMGPVEVWDYCQVDDSAQGLLQAAMKQMHLSARGFHRILKVSRTIADLAGAETIVISHLAEALQYRPTAWG